MPRTILNQLLTPELSDQYWNKLPPTTFGTLPKVFLPHNHVQPLRRRLHERRRSSRSIVQRQSPWPRKAGWGNLLQEVSPERFFCSNNSPGVETLGYLQPCLRHCTTRTRARGCSPVRTTDSSPVVHCRAMAAARFSGLYGRRKG
jgi:hypothetical protein